jgi:hypothetical protein
MRRASLVLLENFERLLTIFYNLLDFIKKKKKSNIPKYMLITSTYYHSDSKTPPPVDTRSREAVSSHLRNC